MFYSEESGGQWGWFWVWGGRRLRPIEPVDDWKKVRLPSTTTTKQWSGLIACTFLEGWFTDLSFVWSLFQTIQVGSDYQATVPDGLCKYGDAPGNVSSVDMMYIAWWIHKHFWVIITWIKMINLISSAIFWGILCWIDLSLIIFCTIKIMYRDYGPSLIDYNELNLELYQTIILTDFDCLSQLMEMKIGCCGIHQR